MSDTTSTPEGTPADSAPEATPPAETFSLEYVQQLRGEAAKYRNEKKSAVEAAKTETAQEWEGKLNTEKSKYAELQSKYDAKSVEMAKLLAAIELEVPSDKLLSFADLIKGDDEDSIKASAKSVLDLVGGFAEKPDPATDPTQGKGGGTLPLNGDPLLNALKRAVGA